MGDLNLKYYLEQAPIFRSTDTEPLKRDEQTLLLRVSAWKYSTGAVLRKWVLDGGNSLKGLLLVLSVARGT